MTGAEDAGPTSTQEQQLDFGCFVGDFGLVQTLARDERDVPGSVLCGRRSAILFWRRSAILFWRCSTILWRYV